jgi:hypothetical protein
MFLINQQNNQQNQNSESNLGMVVQIILLAV